MLHPSLHEEREEVFLGNNFSILSTHLQISLKTVSNKTREVPRLLLRADRYLYASTYKK